MQPAGVFPLFFERERRSGESVIVMVKDAKDRGTELGSGRWVTLNPRGGAAFVATRGFESVVVVDAGGKDVRRVARGGKVGRPAFHSSGNMLVAEFVGEQESELIRFPLNGRGPEQSITVLNKGTGLANPAYETTGTHLVFRVGSAWSLVSMNDFSASKLEVKGLTGSLPKGSVVTEIRPSPMAPNLAAVAVEVSGSVPVRMVMVWNRSSGSVSRVSEVGTDGYLPDWSRDGRSVLFHARNPKTDRVGLVAVSPNGGTPVEIAVLKEASR